MPGGRVRPRKSPKSTTGLRDMFRHGKIAWDSQKYFRRLEDIKKNPEPSVKGKRTVEIPSANKNYFARNFDIETALMSKSDKKKMKVKRPKPKTYNKPKLKESAQRRIKKSIPKRLDRQVNRARMERYTRSNI